MGTPDSGSLSSRLLRAIPRIRTPADRQIEVRPTRKRQALAEPCRPALQTLRQPPQRTSSINQGPCRKLHNPDGNADRRLSVIVLRATLHEPGLTDCAGAVRRFVAAWLGITGLLRSNAPA